MEDQFSRVLLATFVVLFVVATSLAKDKPDSVFFQEKSYRGVSVRRVLGLLENVVVQGFSRAPRQPEDSANDSVFIEEAGELRVTATAVDGLGMCSGMMVSLAVRKSSGAKFPRDVATGAANKLFLALDEIAAPEQARAELRHAEEAKRLAGIQSLLVGKNIRAVVALPVWLEGQRREFPPGRNLKPGEVGTITAVGMFGYYPLPATDISGIGTCVGDSRSRSLVLFLNGAQARVLPPKTALPGRDLRLDAVAESLDTFLSIAGGPLTSIQAQQRQQMREQERTTEEQRLSRLEAGQREAERAYNDGGPEIVIRLDADEQVPSLAKLAHRLRELVQLEPTPSHPTSR